MDPKRFHDGQVGTLLDLPDDVIFLILEYCDTRTLGRLSWTCRKLSNLANYDCVWVKKANQQTVIQKKRYEDVCQKDTIRLSRNFVKGIYNDFKLLHHRVKQIPWLQLDADRLWISMKNVIKCYKHYRHRQNRAEEYAAGAVSPIETHGDVCRFKSNGQLLVCGSRKGQLSVHSAQTGQPLMQQHDAHTSDVQDVDFIQTTVVSGSRENTVKIWSMGEDRLILREDIDVEDRVWSIAVNPDASSFSVGTPGIRNIPALRTYDLHSGELLRSLHHGHKNGAGVLHIVYESPHVMYTCGYDTSVRLWDLRLNSNDSAQKWYDPHDSTVYCISPAGAYSFLSGTAYHSVVRLWDTRQTACVNTYYVNRNSYSSSSPVYSLAHNSKHMYVALDRSVNVLDFSVY